MGAPSRLKPAVAERLAEMLPEHVPLQPFAPVPPSCVARPGLRIAAVLDEMSFRCWQYEADLVPLRVDDWRDVLARRPPDLLLVESAWQGPGGRWGRLLLPRRRFARPLPSPLRRLLRWCRRRDIPTVFHAKEDPVDLELFIDAARDFDFVFTTDRSSEPRYRRARPGHRVGTLPFAAQPKLHNPGADPSRRPRDVIFAGAWYAERHARRRRDAEVLLRPALDFGLEIFDRSGGGDPQFAWPSPYASAVAGSLPYALLLQANRCYKVGLNLNTVTDSPTMLSRRVFELLASGTCVLSSPARSIDELLGQDAVRVCRDEAAVREHLQRLLGTPLERERLAALGIRRVLEHHTYGSRLDDVLEAVGLGRRREPLRVDAVAPVADCADAERARAHFDRQRYAGRGDLVLCVRSREVLRELREGGPEPVRTCFAPETSWGGALARAVAEVRSPWFALMHPGHYYGPHFLTDQAHACQWAEAGAVGKPGRFVSGSGGRLEARKMCTTAAPAWSLVLERAKGIALAERLRSAQSLQEWGESMEAALGSVCFTHSLEYVEPAGGTQPVELNEAARAEVSV